MVKGQIFLGEEFIERFKGLIRDKEGIREASRVQRYTKGLL